MDQSRWQNELDFDYIITNKKQLVPDLTALGKLSLGSDHRMARATAVLKLKGERRKSYKQTKRIKRGIQHRRTLRHNKRELARR